MKYNNLINNKFTKLKVIGYCGKNKWHHNLWKCLCDCGKEKIITQSDLKLNKTRSCGCLLKEMNHKRLVKHSHAIKNKKTRTYNIWINILTRCNNTKNRDYKNYGGRGIKVCDRWLKFESFLEDMGECPSTKYSIDRINNDKGYYKENCHWATAKEQGRNQRTNHLITFNNKTQCLSAWAEEYNIPYNLLEQRINRGKMSIEKAIKLPIRKKNVN